MTIRQNAVWKDPQTFYRHTLRYAPKSWTALNNLGSLLEKKREWNKAAKEYRLALEIDPGLVESHYFLAKTYETMREKTLAEMEYRYFKKRGLRIEILK